MIRRFVLLMITAVAFVGVAAPAGATPRVPVAGAARCHVPGNLVANCGFETGSFGPWTLSDDASGYTGVYPGAARTGGYGASFGAFGAPGGTITQTITAKPNTAYSLSFWLASVQDASHFVTTIEGTSAGTVSFDDSEQQDGLDIYDYTHVVHDLTTDDAGVVTVSLTGYNHDGYAVLDDVSLAPRGSLPQSIAFTSTAPSNAVVGDVYTVTAAGGESHEPVTFSATSATCSVDAGGSVVFRHPGTCRIAADEAGNTDYSRAPTTYQLISVARRSQTIVFTSTPPARPLVGEAYQATASGGGSGEPVQFHAPAASVSCTVSTTGTVLFVAPGRCVVIATQRGNADYNAALHVRQVLTVRPAQATSRRVDHVGTPDVASGGNDSATQCETVPGNVVANCGFETGSLSSWTVMNDPYDLTFIYPYAPHTGGYSAGLGTLNDDPTLFQTIHGLTPHAHYSLSFYLANINPAADEGDERRPAKVAFAESRFFAQVQGTSAGTQTFNDMSEADEFGYRHFVDDFTTDATGTITVDFLGGNVGDIWLLDDVAVAPRGVLTQAITFTSTPPSHALVGHHYRVTATGGDSGRPVMFSVPPVGRRYCTVSPHGLVTFTAPGVCVVAADQSSTKDFTVAPTAYQQISVAKQA